MIYAFRGIFLLRMLILIIQLIISLAAIILSADWMTNGASAIALKMNIKPFIVGLTIVAMGTSAPELFVSLSSALEAVSSGNAGMGDIAIGNVVGSNIFNNLLIVGSVALITPLAVKKITVKRDLPIVAAASVLLLLFLFNGSLSRWEGLVFFVCFILYMWTTVREAKSSSDDDEQIEGVKDMAVWKAIGLIIIGLTILVFAADKFVEYASAIASNLNVSEKIVGLTIVGAGTSAPELATSIMAARKGQGDMAIGNVIGSNIFNILMILGLTGIIQPIEDISINYIDLGVLIFAAILFWLFSFTKYKLERWEGGVLLALCAGYITWLVINA